MPRIVLISAAALALTSAAAHAAPRLLAPAAAGLSAARPEGDG